MRHSQKDANRCDTKTAQLHVNPLDPLAPSICGPIYGFTYPPTMDRAADFDP
jgi:hypothetical protein